eukprot:155401-Pleurochrysis_carterae.AAC.2
MRDFEYDGRGLTANARQPNGRMLMMRGFSPTSISYDEALVLGGPVVRFSISTAWSAAWSQKPMGLPPATSDARVSSITERMARSATLFS